jgi:adenine-specific DNA-methyltransferase
LYNLLLAEGLPLNSHILTLQEHALYQANDVLFILQSIATEILREMLDARQTVGTPIHHLSIYAPWVQDNNFLLGIKTLLESLGRSEDTLRLRG